VPRATIAPPPSRSSPARPAAVQSSAPVRAKACALTLGAALGGGVVDGTIEAPGVAGVVVVPGVVVVVVPGVVVVVVPGVVVVVVPGVVVVVVPGVVVVVPGVVVVVVPGVVVVVVPGVVVVVVPGVVVVVVGTSSPQNCTLLMSGTWPPGFVRPVLSKDRLPSSSNLTSIEALTTTTVTTYPGATVNVAEVASPVTEVTMSPPNSATQALPFHSYLASVVVPSGQSSFGLPGGVVVVAGGVEVVVVVAGGVEVVVVVAGGVEVVVVVDGGWVVVVVDGGCVVVVVDGGVVVVVVDGGVVVVVAGGVEVVVAGGVVYEAE
jgi:hypothetical protein